jgi:hypothetical protein
MLSAGRALRRKDSCGGNSPVGIVVLGFLRKCDRNL